MEQFQQTWVNGMKKALLAGGVACLVSLAGCASHNIIARNVETAPGVNTFSADGGNYIGSIAMRRALTESGSDKVQSCLASSVEEGKGTESAASSPEQAGQEDNKSSMEPNTQRITGWTDAGGKTLAYRLEVQTIGHSNYYYYDQLGTSVSRSQNPGDYSPLGAWDGDQASKVYGALSKVTDQVQGCLSGDASATSTKADNQSDPDASQAQAPAASN